MRQAYIYKIEPTRPDLIQTMTEQEQAVMGEHFAYLQNLLEQGTLLMAGPCEDAAFGIAVYYAESEQEAQAIMENDPAVRERIMTAEFHAFRVSFLAENITPQ